MKKITRLKEFVLKNIFGSLMTAAAVLMTSSANPLFADVSGVSLEQSAPQTQKRITLNLQNKPLDQILTAIKKQTGVQFGYKSGNGINKAELFSIKVTDETIQATLTKLFAESRYSYIYENNLILVITKSMSKHVSISGCVYDEKKQPMMGATVVVPGTSIGASTDSKGNFKIKAPLGANLEIGYIGYKKIVHKVSSAVTNANFFLQADITTVDKVQVVAYGTQNKREVTGAIESVTADQLKDVPSASLANLLQGKVSGMSVLNTSGAPGGGGTTVTIRGFNSLSIEGERRLSEPLWVIDGVPVPNFTSPVTGTNSMADIDPNMIESIEILKDAASASIYGSRAANGVILVTTKKGSRMKSTFSFNYSESWSFNPVTPTITGGVAERQFRTLQARNFVTGYRVMNPDKSYYYKTPTSFDEVYGGGKGNYDLFWNSGNGLDIDMLQDSMNTFYNNSTNWMKEFMQVGRVRNANVQVGGGGETMRYYFGAGYYSERGVMVGTDFNRINLSGNFTMNPIKGAVIDSRIYIAYTDREKGRTGYLGSELFDIKPFETSTLLPASGSAVFSDYVSRRDGIKEDNYDYKVRSNNSISYTIVRGLELSASLGIDYWQSVMNYFRPSYLGTVRQDGSQESYVSGTIGRSLTLLNENLAKYHISWGDHSRFDFLLGQSSQIEQIDRVQGVATGGPSDFIHYATAGFPEVGYQDDGTTARATQSFGSSMTRKSLMSWFGRLNYVFKDRYLASFTYRRDGSSTFGDNNKWATFPSVSLGWIFSEEPFVKNSSLGRVMNFAKLRASVGKSGLQFSSPYLAYGVYVPQTVYFMGQAALAPEWKEGAPNPSLKWEETTQYDVGVDLQFLNNRFAVTLDGYIRITDDMLTPISLVGSGSFNPYRNQWQNACSISNSGIELKIEADLIQRKDLQWSVTFNYARNWNKLRNSIGRRDFSSSSSNISIVGKPLNQHYVYQYNGIYQSDSDVPTYDYIKDRYTYTLYGGSTSTNIYRAGDPIYLDLNQDGKITSADKVFAGSPLPTAVGGFSSSLKYRNFDFNCLFAYTLGRKILDASLGTSFTLNVSDPTMVHVAHPILADLNDYTFWTSAESSANMPMVQADAGRMVFSQVTTRDIRTVNYLKLKSMVIGYTLKKPFKRNQMGLRVYLSGENLLTISNYKGRDPETIDLVTGIDGSQAYPLATKITIGATLNF